MWINKQIKKNNGSALTIVLFMLFMLSITAIAVLALTSSELSLSVMTSDRSKAMQYAQAGAENAAKIIDAEVAQAQENARAEASKKIEKAINDVKNTCNIEDGKKVYYIDSKSVFYDIIDNYDPNDIKIIDKNKFNDLLKNEYEYQLDYLIRTNKTIDDLVKSTGNFENGEYAYVNLKRNPSSEKKKHSLDTSTNYFPIKSISITSNGRYNSPGNGSVYKRSITAEFEVLTENMSKQIGYMTTERVNNIKEKPSIISNKALIAQKNIISLDGMTNITGDVVDCGTMPKYRIHDDGEYIDYSADSYAFGGILAGINNSNTVATTNKFWDVPDLGAEIKKDLIDNPSLASALEISDVNKYIQDDHDGSFIFNGNVGTLSYIHSLFSSSGKKSRIMVTNNSYARSAVVESESNDSLINFQNLFTFDDLKIDGNNAQVSIGNNNKEGKLVGLNEKLKSGHDKISSAVIVAGDSYLDVKGSVFVGGSSFYTDYKDGTGNTYAPGISIQKSDDRPAAAFEKGGNTENSDNNFYKYKNSNTNTNPIDKYEIVPQDKINWLSCKNNSKYMMSGFDGNFFSIAEKAMHFARIWDVWKDNVEYGSYFNTGDITISKGAHDKLKGFCYGGVAANDTFYGPYEGFENKEDDYKREVTDGLEAYSKLMDLFIPNKDLDFMDYFNIPSFTDNTKKLKELDENINLNNTISKNTINKVSNSFIYYGDENIVLTDSSITDKNDSKNFTAGTGSGIIYTKGNIYVKEQTTFNGILIAEGNIVFFGGSNINYSSDVVDELLTNKNVRRFFKFTETDVVMDNSSVVQTINKDTVSCIKIISWKEV